MLGVRAYSEGGRNDKEPQEAHSCEGDRRENSMHDPTLEGWCLKTKTKNSAQAAREAQGCGLNTGGGVGKTSKKRQAFR